MALVPCNTTDDCNLSYIRGSECISETGYCSNPFYKKGCLSYLRQQNVPIPQHNNIRVCSSSDPPEAQYQGYCTPAVSHFDYTEIRLLGNNWESVFFETWIVQILLSEILGVPTSVETGFPDLSIDFYDEFDRFDYGKAYDWDGMRLASEIGDCRLVEQSQNASEYKSCAHATLEVWEGQFHMTEELKEEQVIENPSPLGLLGNAGWFIPLFTGIQDPTLLTYLGLWGEENRQKLAETFKRPTTWLDYCKEVSTTNCTVPDEFAMRPPINDTDEENQYFVAGLYTGYFRKTAENDCETWPTNCTGHFVDFPCGWSSFFEQQAYHLGIALQSSGSEPYCKGYKYSHMLEIWHAANATKSNVMMFYWTPEALVQTYEGSDAKFQKVILPVATEKCFESRVQTSDRCNPNRMKRIGSKEGVCDAQAHALMKFVTSNLYDITNKPSISEARRSPAYDAVNNFQINGFQLGNIFDKWLKSSSLTNSANNDSIASTNRITGPREAVCQWVGENYEVLQRFVPRTYPRIVVDGDHTIQGPLFYGSIALAIIGLLFLFIICTITYQRRRKRIIVVAQVEFLFLLLEGLALVQTGTVTLAVPPSNGSCLFAVWTINLGYTLELVPLIVKMAAINKLMSAARQMKRIKLDRSSLIAGVVIVLVAMTGYLLSWTILDPFNKAYEYKLTEELNNDGDTIVEVYSFCQSDSPYWVLVVLVWRSILLVSATVLAFLTRKSPINFNESKTLGGMIYSQGSFLVWTLLLFGLRENVEVSSIARYLCLIQSLDVMAVLCIYFLPKLLTSDESFRRLTTNQRQSVISSSTWQHSAAQEDHSISNSVCEPVVLRQVRFDLQDSTKSSTVGVNDCSKNPSSAHNEEPNIDEDEGDNGNGSVNSPLVSHFEFCSDHIEFKVQYRNPDGNSEIIRVKCFEDSTKCECYKEEEEMLLQQMSEVVDESSFDQRSVAFAEFSLDGSSEVMLFSETS